MIKRYIHFVLVLLTLASCAKRPAKDIAKPEVINTSAVKDYYALVVSFYSIGSGINREALRKFLDYIDNYKKKYSKILNILEAPWGREGEVDYCIGLDDLKTNEKINFIAGVKSLLEKEEFIHLNTDAPCSNKRK